MKQVTFKGFDSKTSAEERVNLIDSFLKSRSLKADFIDHFYTGPKNAQVLTAVSFAQFPSESHASHSLRVLGGKKAEVQLSDTVKVVVKKGVTMINRRRNWALRKAFEILVQKVKSKQNVKLILVTLAMSRWIT